MEKELHSGAPPGAKATQQGALPGVKAIALLGVKAKPLPGVKVTIQGPLLGDQATGPPPGLQEQEVFRTVHVVTAPGAKYPRALNTTQLSR